MPSPQHGRNQTTCHGRAARSFPPRAAELGEPDGGVKEQRSLGAGARLSQFLRGRRAEREPPVDEVLGKPSAASSPRFWSVSKPTSLACATPSSRLSKVLPS